MALGVLRLTSMIALTGNSVCGTNLVQLLVEAGGPVQPADRWSGSSSHFGSLESCSDLQCRDGRGLSLAGCRW
jgi:hypothetical protein